MATISFLRDLLSNVPSIKMKLAYNNSTRRILDDQYWDMVKTRSGDKFPTFGNDLPQEIPGIHMK